MLLIISVLRSLSTSYTYTAPFGRKVLNDLFLPDNFYLSIKISDNLSLLSHLGLLQEMLLIHPHLQMTFIPNFLLSYMKYVSAFISS